MADIAADYAGAIEQDIGRPVLLHGTATGGYFFSEDLFRRTAAGLTQGRAVVLPGMSHVYVAGSKVTAGVALGFLQG
jgi:hypothetical protein